MKELFKKLLPDSCKKPLKYIYGYMPPRFRYGRTFWDTYNFLQESQWWNREKLEAYQMQQLSNLLHHAYENVPYYRRVFDERNLQPKDIQNFNDLRKLPYLTKDTFTQHFEELVAKNVMVKGLPTSHTSGTTGKPIRFYENHYTAQKERAFIYHQWSRVGFKPTDRLVQLRGSVIKGGKPVDYDPISKILRLSPRIDSKEIVHYYLEKMQQFGAHFLHGYPSSIAVYASMIKQNGLSPPFKLKAVLFASETIYPWEREITREVFNCHTFAHYGMAEKVVLAGECESAHHYHCLPQYGITEFRTDLNEIVGTSFINHINPFIRYRTTDIASQPLNLGCCDCGRYYHPVFSSVEGRLEDFIITSKGTPISPAVITHPFKDLKTIRDTQIIQESLDCITLKIVPWTTCDPKILKTELWELYQGLQNILGTTMNIETEMVESVQPSGSGKFKWITSKVSKDSLQKGTGVFQMQ